MNKNVKIFEYALYQSIENIKELNKKYILNGDDKTLKKLKEENDFYEEIKELLNALKNGAKIIIFGGKNNG